MTSDCGDESDDSLLDTAERPIILSLLGCYWPEHSSAGPNQSYRGMVQALSGKFSFTVVARDRAFGSVEPLVATGKRSDAEAGVGDVIYVQAGLFGIGRLCNLLHNTRYDLLILNGFFDRDFTLPVLWMRRLRLIPRRPTLLSPRGELAPGALGLKSTVKRAHLSLAKAAGLLSDVWLHATSEDELDNNKQVSNFARGHLLAANVSPRIAAVPICVPTEGQLRLIFLGRITRVKNLDFALRILLNVSGALEFIIYGPISDPIYWAECEAIIASLPPHITARRHGEVSNSEVPTVLSAFDALMLPTLGENFGHSIHEALSCGLPVLISDRTPWRDLVARQAGWDLPLEQPQTWTAAIEELAKMSAEERAVLRQNAKALARMRANEVNGEAATANMFHVVLAAHSEIHHSDRPVFGDRTDAASR